LRILLQDLRHAFRTLIHKPVFSAVSILTLGLGIGAATAIFSVVYGVLLRPLPYDHPEQIVRLWEADETGHRMNFADPNFEDVRDQNHSLQEIAQYYAALSSVYDGKQAVRAMVGHVSRDFFAIFRVQPVLGRSFLPEEQRFGAAPVALVRYGYWKQYLAGNTDLSSVKLIIDNHPVAVVGILPADFNFPETAEVWLARELDERLPSRTAHNWRVVARVKDGISVAQASADLSSIGARIKQQFGSDVQIAGVAALPLQTAMTGSVRPVLLLLLGAVAFLLLIACANVANLMLAQAASRQRELAIRSALGAARVRIVRQFLTEAILLVLIAGAFGVLAAIWGVRLLLSMNADSLPQNGNVSVQAPVLAFALLLSFLIAIALGLFCALRATGSNLQSALIEGGQRQAGSARSNRIGRLIVSAQLAAALVLLVGAGLLARSLLRVLATDPGFHTDRILTLNLALPSVENATAGAHRVAFLNELLARLRTLPGVQQAGGTTDLPLTESPADGTYLLFRPGESLPQNPQDFEKLFRQRERTGSAYYTVAGDGYFEALGIPLLRGRSFDQRDTADAPHAALISDSLAREKWPGQDPLGRLIEFGHMDGDPRLLTVVGVVGDIRVASLEKPPYPTIYVSYRQRPQKAQDFTIVVRTGGQPASLIGPVQSLVRELDSTIPPRISTFSQVFSASLESRRFALILMAVFSCTAMILAMAGVYGVISYSVAQRTREFGVRMAIGAVAGDVFRLVLREGMAPVLAGILIGIGGGFALARTMQSFVFGVSSADPLTFVTVAAALLVVALVACYMPARRATRVDPLVALRYE
jgi:putative ABC transport system permease protein